MNRRRRFVLAGIHFFVVSFLVSWHEQRCYRRAREEQVGSAASFTVMAANLEAGSLRLAINPWRVTASK